MYRLPRRVRCAAQTPLTSRAPGIRITSGSISSARLVNCPGSGLTLLLGPGLAISRPVSVAFYLRPLYQRAVMRNASDQLRLRQAGIVLSRKSDINNRRAFHRLQQIVVAAADKRIFRWRWRSSAASRRHADQSCTFSRSMISLARKLASSASTFLGRA